MSHVKPSKLNRAHSESVERRTGLTIDEYCDGGDGGGSGAINQKKKTQQRRSHGPPFNWRRTASVVSDTSPFKASSESPSSPAASVVNWENQMLTMKLRHLEDRLLLSQRQLLARDSEQRRSSELDQINQLQLHLAELDSAANSTVIGSQAKLHIDQSLAELIGKIQQCLADHPTHCCRQTQENSNSQKHDSKAIARLRSRLRVAMFRSAKLAESVGHTRNRLHTVELQCLSEKTQFQSLIARQNELIKGLETQLSTASAQIQAQQQRIKRLTVFPSAAQLSAPTPTNVISTISDKQHGLTERQQVEQFVEQLCSANPEVQNTDDIISFLISRVKYHEWREESQEKAVAEKHSNGWQQIEQMKLEVSSLQKAQNELIERYEKQLEHLLNNARPSAQNEEENNVQSNAKKQPEILKSSQSYETEDESCMGEADMEDTHVDDGYRNGADDEHNENHMCCHQMPIILKSVLDELERLRQQIHEETLNTDLIQNYLTKIQQIEWSKLSTLDEIPVGPSTITRSNPFYKVFRMAVENLLKIKMELERKLNLTKKNCDKLSNDLTRSEHVEMRTKCEQEQLMHQEIAFLNGRIHTETQRCYRQIEQIKMSRTEKDQLCYAIKAFLQKESGNMSGDCAKQLTLLLKESQKLEKQNLSILDQRENHGAFGVGGSKAIIQQILSGTNGTEKKSGTVLNKEMLVKLGYAVEQERTHAERKIRRLQVELEEKTDSLHQTHEAHEQQQRKLSQSDNIEELNSLKRKYVRLREKLRTDRVEFEEKLHHKDVEIAKLSSENAQKEKETRQKSASELESAKLKNAQLEQRLEVEIDERKRMERRAEESARNGDWAIKQARSELTQIQYGMVQHQSAAENAETAKREAERRLQECHVERIGMVTKIHALEEELVWLRKQLNQVMPPVRCTSGSGEEGLNSKSDVSTLIGGNHTARNTSFTDRNKKSLPTIEDLIKKSQRDADMALKDTEQ